MYEQGKGVVHDDAKAVELWTLAAEQGFAVAQFELGAMHATGRGGLPQDFAQAAMWWKRAAGQGNEDAIKNLRMLLDKLLFPPGTAVQLVGMKAASFNGKRGAVVKSKAAGIWKVAVLVEGGKKYQLAFENLVRK